MSHRTVIKFLIVVVISIVVVWSVVNISDYAYTFHANWIVYSMGLALGTANALSVYAFVMAKTTQVQRPAVLGIILFGGMSAVLQVLLYVQVGAPLLAALAFGTFGPVAEGVLAWLHAALSEEPATRKTSDKQASKGDKKGDKFTSSNDKQNVKPQLTPELTALIDLGDKALGDKLGVSRQSVYTWKKNGVVVDKILERLPELATPTTNGKEHI